MTEITKNNRPFFSIITVCLNNKDLLEDTIKSVIDQEYKNYEYIIIDGGSIDGTLDLIKKYENFIDKWKSEPDRGIYDAMNKGINMSDGQYLLFLNSGDSLYDRKTLQLVSNFLNNKNNIGICYGKVELINKKLNISKQFGEKIKYDILWKGMPICHQSIFFNKQLFNLLGLYDLKYKILADYEFLFRYFVNKKNYDFVDIYLDYVISKYLIGGISLKNNISSLNEVKDINEKYTGLSLKKIIYYKYIKVFLIFKNLLMEKSPQIFNFFSKIRYNISKK